MSSVALRMDGVSKKFRKGELYTSLRDLVPGLARRMFRSSPNDDCGVREFWALHNISFEVQRGEAFGIIGPNGAGKSTILKLLSQVMKPTRGSMLVDGRVSALIELGAGFHADLTGRENVYLYGSILGMTRRDIKQRFDQIVDFAGLSDFIDTPVKRYSSGMYARLGFAVAAHVNPDVLLVDEVLSVGDTLFQRKCLEHMRRIIKDGATVIFVSHNLKSMADFCHRCMLLQKGTVQAIGAAQNVLATYLNTTASGGEQNHVDKVATISRVTVRGHSGECAEFESGQTAWVDIDITAHKRCDNLSVCLFMKNQELQDIFDTSTQRLGYPGMWLREGGSVRCTFQLSLNMTSGLYHPSILLYNYDTQTRFDSWECPATIHVSAAIDSRGPVNCFPVVEAYQTIPTLSGQSLECSA